MAKQIQAYFKSENDAESAKTALLTYKTENLEVSSLEGTLGRSNNILVPLVPIGGGSGGSQTGGAQGAVGTPGPLYDGNVIPIVESDEAAKNRDDRHARTDHDRGLLDSGEVELNDYNDLRYVLVAKVTNEHYEEIVTKLRNVGAYVERFD